MVAAGVAALTVLVVVVIAADIRIVAEISGQQRMDSRVGITADTAEEPDARLCQRLLRAAADAAADERVHTVLHQEASQRTMAAAVGIDHFGSDDPVAVDLIDLELLGVAKVLEDLAVCVGNCNFHVCFSFVFLHIRMGIF